MKNIITLFAAVCITLTTSAQITLEHTYGPALTTLGSAILFTDAGTKIMANDTGTNQIKLYNTDHSLWKTINIPIPAGNRLYIVQYVSDKLFNTDGSIEAFVSWQSTSPPSVLHAAIINESGTIIKDFGDNAYYSQVYYLDSRHKLFVSTASPSYQTMVYDLPGELPCGHCGAGSVGVPKSGNTGGGNAPVAMPNPATNQVTIQHQLTHPGYIIISGTDGKDLGSYPVSGNQPTITVDISQFPAGIYYFSVNAEGREPAVGSFVK